MNPWPWSYFDQISCINLITRDDRYQECQNLFNKMNINVVFHRVQRHPKGGEAGCFQSHLDIIREAYINGCNTCLILEDDIELSSTYSIQLVEQAVQFMKSNCYWELFYFGCTPEIIRHTIQPTSMKSIYHLNGLDAHAYVIHRRLMEKMVGEQYIGVAIDQLYIHNKYAYGILPSLIIQKPGKSDIALHHHLNPISEVSFRRVWICMQLVLIILFIRYL